MFNFMLGLFVYAVVGTITFKLVARIFSLSIDNDDGAHLFAGIFWPIAVPITIAFFGAIYIYEKIIDPFTDKIINSGEKKIEKFCKDKKNRNID
jgi:hypothetical protein